MSAIPSLHDPVRGAGEPFADYRERRARSNAEGKAVARGRLVPFAHATGARRARRALVKAWGIRQVKRSAARLKAAT